MKQLDLKSVITLIAVLAASFTFVNCSSDDEELPDTKYRIVYNEDFSLFDLVDCSVDLTCYEYNDLGEIIGKNIIKNIKDRDSRIFKANKNAIKIKIHLTIVSENTVAKGFISEIYYLKQHEGNEIVINLNDGTMFDDIEYIDK